MLTAFTASVCPEQQGRLLSPGLRTVAGGACGPLLAWGPCLLQSKEIGCPGLETPKGPPPPLSYRWDSTLCLPTEPTFLSRLLHQERQPPNLGSSLHAPPHRQPPSPPPTPKSAFLSWDSPDLTLFTHFFPYQPQCSVKRERGRVLEMPPTPGSLPEDTRAHLLLGPRALNF